MPQLISLLISIALIIYTGILLSKSKYPFNSLQLAIHKLLSLAVVITISIAIYRSPKLLGSNEFVIAVLTTLYIVSFASGAVISAMQDTPTWVIWTHRACAWIAILSMIVILMKISGKY